MSALDQNNIYTRSERTVRKYTVGQALASAERVLRKKGIKGTCVNALKQRELTDKIALKEIADAIIWDSIAYALTSHSTKPKRSFTREVNEGYSDCLAGTRIEQCPYFPVESEPAQAWQHGWRMAASYLKGK